MSFNPTEIAFLGRHGLDKFLKNKPVDQLGTDRPWLKFLLKKKSFFNGGVQYVVEQLRKSYDSNFQWYQGADAVTYNKRDTVAQAKFSWGSIHDGFTLSEDDLFSNGISINDNMKNASTANEGVQLTQLFDEHMEALHEGFDEKFDYEMHLDGTQDSDAVAGLDHLISLDGTGTVGGIDASTSAYWANNFDTSGVVEATVIDRMEIQWRKCVRHGGSRPDYILCGSTFLDTFRRAAKTDIARYTILNTGGETVSLDPAISNLHFNNVPLIWDPVFEDLDANLSPATPWEKRCYFVNSKHMKYRPAKGHDMVPRNPPRQYDRYVWYWALTHKMGLTTNKRNAFSVLALD
jgi:hypothetical protein